MKTHPVLCFLLFTCFLVIGYTASLRFYQPGDAILSGSIQAITSEGRKSLPAMENGQHSILLVGASSLNPQSSYLESLWLATYLPSDTAIQLLPIYPSGKQQATSFEKQLNLAFGLSKTAGVTTFDLEFAQLLEENNYWWSGYVIFEQAALEEAFDLPSRVSENEESLSGIQVAEASLGVLDRPQNAYPSQVMLLQAACGKLSTTSTTRDIDQLISLSSGHVLTDLETSQLQTEWETLSSHGHNLTCRYPTLEISRIEP